MVFVEESIRRQSRHRVLMPRAQWPRAASQRDHQAQRQRCPRDVSCCLCCGPGLRERGPLLDTSKTLREAGFDDAGARVAGRGLAVLGGVAAGGVQIHRMGPCTGLGSSFLLSSSACRLSTQGQVPRPVFANQSTHFIDDAYRCRLGWRKSSR